MYIPTLYFTKFGTRYNASLTFTVDGKRQGLRLILFSFLVIRKEITQKWKNVFWYSPQIQMSSCKSFIFARLPFFVMSCLISACALTKLSTAKFVTSSKKMFHVLHYVPPVINCVRRRRTLPNFVGLLWTLAKALRVLGAFYRAGSYDVTFSLRKGFCPRATENSVFFANIGRTSGVSGRVVEEFRSCCCFLGKLFSQCCWRISELLIKAWGKRVPFWAFHRASSYDLLHCPLQLFKFLSFMLLLPKLVSHNQYLNYIVTK